MRIGKVGVIGAGVMGSGIAALTASAGFPVVLLDVPADPDRNALAKNAVQRALAARPAPFMDPARASLITTGNTDDHLELLRDCDWIVEAIIEQPEPKRALFARLEPLIGPNTIVSSNTSGIPIQILADGRSENFRRRFLGTHFFNPVRYLHLLELIPAVDTSPEVIARTRSFAERMLGKGVVIANDVPGFIANRLGLFGLFTALRQMERFDLTIDEVDALTGPLIGRPRSATFRTSDISGLDVLVHVSEGLSQATGEDFSLPKWVHELVRQGRLGEKSGAGFYRKEGKQILTLDWKTGEYKPQEPPPLTELAYLRQLPLEQRLKGLTTAGGRYAEYVRTVLVESAHYTLEKTPQLAHDISSVDRALEWGFGWEIGPFRVFDAMGVTFLRGAFAERGLSEPPLLATAKEGFYRRLGSGPRQLSFAGEYTPIEPIPGHLDLSLVKMRVGTLAKNDDASILDVGDGVLLLELHGKMNTLGKATLDMLARALELADRGNFAGLAIGSDDPRTFSAGANLNELLPRVESGDWKGIEAAVRDFQQAIANIRRATFPDVAAPFGITFGGGAELVLHAARVQAHAELAIGFVEAGLGLLPAGGGTKELLFRFTNELAPYEEADPFEAVKRAFKLIAMATTSTSALHASGLGFLRHGDRISMNRDRLLNDARARVLELAPDYRPPVTRTIRALGREGLGNLEYAVWAMREANRATDHDVVVGRKIAWVLCGGDGPAREVTEQDILDLEREAFLSLLGTKETQARIAHMLKTGQPLRN
ncbi:MAG TPA: 3-hydroxyacyl-CoA dehydrogenase/enoyl-CoA hydratase family protein [Gemmatimonadaceae bacterium]